MATGGMARVYMLALDNSLIIEEAELQRGRHRNREVETIMSGTHRFFLDNSQGQTDIVMHLLVTYHWSAPGAAIHR